MLQLDNVNIGYGDVQVVWDLSFSIEKGETVAIIGANGAGKSTTLKTIAGLMKSIGGSIRFEGIELMGKSTPDINNAGISLVPEGRQIFPNMTVEENLLLGAYLKRARVHRDKTLVEMYELFPILKERRLQKAGTLSGGEQQMLTVSRGLMSLPRLIMLDEPSLGLAPKVIDLIFDSIQLMRSKLNLTTLIVEQDVRKALRLADRAYVMVNGRIVKEGLSKDLLEDPDIKKAYLGI
ncbi:MAG: ABC transporter ATP-binding protein [Spirochaetes bacterium]|nr:ABC transporter ATP-binding protein [Spirochaetota bacterium]